MSRVLSGSQCKPASTRLAVSPDLQVVVPIGERRRGCTGECRGLKHLSGSLLAYLPHYSILAAMSSPDSRLL